MSLFFIRMVLLSTLATGFPVDPPSNNVQTGNKLRSVDWYADGQEALRDRLKAKPKVRPAKNVIMFIGDGMGVSTVTAARVLKAQKEKKSLHETRLSWEQFPYTSMSITYCINQMTPDSASSGTAILTGAKTNVGMLGVDQRVKLGNCGTVTEEKKLRSILKHSYDEGKWTGIVTTARVTDATPAAIYAHSADRDWEADYDIPEAEKACKDMARQLIEDNDYIRVIMGGGREKFMPKNETDPEYPNVNGKRHDGQNLMEIWEEKQAGKPGIGSGRVKVVTDQKGFDAIDPKNTDYILGLFETGNMKYEAERRNEPSLQEMVEKAITVLQKSDQGFFLLVEGGKIDKAHHDNRAHLALIETMAFSQAVQKAVDMTNEEDTLIVTTADHSHVFTLAGYTHPDNDILGLSRQVVYGEQDKTSLQLAEDGLPWLPLSYTNGPGYYYHRTENSTLENPTGARRNLTENDANKVTRDVNFVQDSAYPVDIATHGGEDVTVYARGPMAHLFHGSHEESHIAHFMMYASCVGPNKELCTKKEARDGKPGHLDNHLV